MPCAPEKVARGHQLIVADRFRTTCRAASVPPWAPCLASDPPRECCHEAFAEAVGASEIESSMPLSSMTFSIGEPWKPEARAHEADAPLSPRRHALDGLAQGA
jgi:hypothetical protein